MCVLHSFSNFPGSFSSTVNRKLIHFIYTLKYTFLEILKSSNVTAISILSHVFHFFFILRGTLRAQTSIFYDCEQCTENYLSFLCPFYHIYIWYAAGDPRGLAPLSVCATDTRRCWKFCEITRGNAYTYIYIHIYGTRELLHVMKLCRRCSRILVSSFRGQDGRFKWVISVTLQNFICKLNQLCRGIIADIPLFYNDKIIARSF